MLESLLAQGGLVRTVASGLFALTLAYVLAIIAGRLTRRVLSAAMRRDADKDVAPHHPEVSGPVRVVRWTVFAALSLIIVLPAIRLAGLDLHVGLTPEMLSAWLFASGLRIGVIVVVGYLLVRIIGGVSRRLENHIGRAAGIDALEHVKRARTLSRLVQSMMTTIVVVLTLLTILRELNVDITPILTGAGILGLAVGFGGQALVRDLISGFFLIIENQIRVGDTAVINGVTGVVEVINLRTVVLRDGEGSLHVFPNGSIDRLANRSKDYSVYVADFDVATSREPAEIIALLRTVGEQLLDDSRTAALMIEPMQVLGIETMRDGKLTIRVSVKTLPQKNADVGRELLLLARHAFDVNGIETPMPRLAIHMGDGTKPFIVRTQERDSA